MLFYFVVLIGLLLSISDRKVIFAKVYAIIIALIAIFRYGFGSDYFSYFYLYQKIRTTPFAEITDSVIPQEIGFRIIGSFFRFFNMPYQVFVAFFAILSIYYIYKISVEYSNNPTFSMVIYFTFYYLYWTYSSLRQGLAISIGVYYLLEALFKHKEKKFILIALLLSTIHVSSLFLLVFFLASKISISKKKLLILSIVAIGISVFPLGSVINRFSSYSPILTRMAYYIDAPSSFIGIFDFQTIGRLVFMAIAFTFYDSFCNESEENRKIMNIYVFSFIIYFVFKFSELTAARLAIYGKVLDILILVNILSVIKIKWDKYLYLTLLLVLMFMYLYKDLAAVCVQTSLVDNSKFFAPYVNIFNKDLYEFNSVYIDLIVK